MAKLNAFTANTAKNLQLDAGIIVKGLEQPEEFAGELPAGAVTIGATSGGGSFSAIPEMRNIFEDLDGARGEYKGGKVIDNWDISLKVTVKEMTKENLQLALAASESEETLGMATTYKFDKITGRLDIKDEDYLDNICWLGTINGQDAPIIIELKNVLNNNGLALTFTDKGTGGIELELKAHFDLSNPQEVPFAIYAPNGTTV